MEQCVKDVTDFIGDNLAKYFFCRGLNCIDSEVAGDTNQHLTEIN